MQPHLLATPPPPTSPPPLPPPPKKKKRNPAPLKKEKQKEKRKEEEEKVLHIVKVKETDCGISLPSRHIILLATHKHICAHRATELQMEFMCLLDRPRVAELQRKTLEI